jgi:hypothetical protein
LVFFTAILCIATVAYAITTHKIYKASNKQTEALIKLTGVILQLPDMQSSIQDKKEREKELAEAKAEEAGRQAELFKIPKPK